MAERPVQRPSKASAKPKRTQADAIWSSIKWETYRAKKYSKPGTDTDTVSQGQMDKLRKQMEMRRQAAQKGDDPRVSELARKTARLEENGETDFSSDRHAKVESQQSNRGKKRTAGTAAKQSVFPLDNLLGSGTSEPGQRKQHKQAPVPASTMPPRRREESLRPDGKPRRKEDNAELSVRKQDEQVPRTAQSTHVGKGRREQRKINYDPLGAEEKMMEISIHHSKREKQQQPQQDYWDTIPVWSERWLKLKESKQKTMLALSKDALDLSIAAAKKQLGEELERMRRKEREPKYQDLWARMQAAKQTTSIATELDKLSDEQIDVLFRKPDYTGKEEKVQDFYTSSFTDVLFRKELKISGHTCVYPYCVGNKCSLESTNISDPLGVEAGSQEIQETHAQDSGNRKKEQQQKGFLERYPVWSKEWMELKESKQKVVTL